MNLVSGCERVTRYTAEHPILQLSIATSWGGVSPIVVGMAEPQQITG